MSTEMILVWLSMSKYLEKSITMVNVRCKGKGYSKIEGFIMCDREDEANGVVVGSEIMLDRG